VGLQHLQRVQPPERLLRQFPPEGGRPRRDRGQARLSLPDSPFRHLQRPLLMSTYLNRLQQMLLVAVCFCFLTSCEVPYDIPVGRSSNTLVVEGLITNTGLAQTVRLTRSTTYNVTGAPPAVTGAVVTVTPEGGVAVTLPEVSPGLYSVPAASLPGVEGRAYALRVVANGQVHTATDTLRRVPELEFIRWIYTVDGGRDDEELTGFIPAVRFRDFQGVGDHYKLRFYRNGLVYRDGPGDFYFINDRFIDGNLVQEDLEFEAWIYQPGDNYTIELQSLSLPAYNWYVDIAQSVVSNNPFVGPPYNARGNIRGGALGFFRCSGISRVSGIVP